MADKVLGSELHGRRIDLDGGRYVFVGVANKFPTDTGIVFRGKDGSYTSFRLSDEAIDALRSLLTDPASGVPVFTAASPTNNDFGVATGLTYRRIALTPHAVH